MYYSLDEQMVEACDVDFEKFMNDICDREDEGAQRLNESLKREATWAGYSARYCELPQNRIYVK